MKKRQEVLLGVVLLGVVQIAAAQSADDASTACTEAARLIGEQDFAGALDEAKWCVESLEQIKQQGVLLAFPDQIDDFKGADIENQSAMGMTIITRQYSNSVGSIDASLTTGVAGGGLAALAQLGMGMGSGSGKKLRVQKRTVLDLSDSGQAQYMVQLKNGGMLDISSSELSADQVLGFVKAFPIQVLDDSLAP